MSSLSNCYQSPVTIIELVLDVCDNEFGVGPCTASGVPCYNHYNTCKDTCNYVCKTKSYWFSTCGVKLPTHLGILNYSPSLKTISHEPTRLEIGKTISTRGKITLCFEDHAHNDEGFDPYWEDRHVIPIRCAEDVPGTLWGRLIERQKYFNSRRVNVYTGYCEQQNLCEFNKQTYFIDKLTGPDNGCKVCLTLKDPLILAESAKCPSSDPKLVAQQNLGTEFPLAMTLGAPLDAVGEDLDPYALIGTLLLQNNYLAGDADQDKCFERLRHVCIGSEIMRVQAVRSPTLPAGWNIKLVERGTCGTEIQGHDGGAKITLAETFKGHINDVVCQLIDCMELETVSIACCDDEPECVIDWGSFRQFKCDRPLDIISEDVVICKGETVKKLLDELSSQFLFFLYYDAELGKIRIRALNPPVCDIDTVEITICDLVTDSFSTKESDTYYNIIEYEHNVINWAESVDSENLGEQTIVVSADALKETCARNEHKTRSTKTHKSRWISSTNKYLAKAYGDRWLFLRKCVGKQVSFDFSNEYSKCLEFGGYVTICHPKIQTIDGKNSQDLWLVKAKAPGEKCTKVTFEKTPFNKNIIPCMNCDTQCPSPLDATDNCANDCVQLW